MRQVGDGWRDADAAACQHWRPGCSAPTDTVVRSRSDTGERHQTKFSFAYQSARLLGFKETYHYFTVKVSSAATF